MTEKDEVVVLAKTAIYRYSSEATVEIIPSGVLRVTDRGVVHHFSPFGWLEAVKSEVSNQ